MKADLIIDFAQAAALYVTTAKSLGRLLKFHSERQQKRLELESTVTLLYH